MSDILALTDPADVKFVRDRAAEQHVPAERVLHDMIERERAYAEEEERQLTLLIAPELVGSEIGPVTRKPGETDEAYAERSELFALLLKLS